MQQITRSNVSTPFILSCLAPILFFSAIFSILTPLPILYLYLLPPPLFSYLWIGFSILLGTSLSFLLLGPSGGIFFFLLTASSLPLGELLKQKIRPEWGVVSSILSFLVLGAICLFLFLGTNVELLIQEAMTWLQNWAAEQSQKSSINASGKQMLELLAKNPWGALPKIVGIFFDSLIFLYTLPFIILLHWNPQNLHKRIGVSRRFLLEWHSPEYLIWPTLLAAAILIFKVEPLEPIMIVFIHIFLRIYLLHGLSILAFFLHKIQVKALLRIPIYGIAILFLGPMLSSFGFFDLWFDFRKKFKDSFKTKKKEGSDK